MVGIVQVRSSPAAPIYTGSYARSANYFIQRPNDTTAYTANDVIGDAITGTAVWKFANVGPANGGDIIVDEVRFEVLDTGLIASEASHTIHFYSQFPPSNLADNAAFDITSGDRLFYQGKLTVGTPVDEGTTLYVAITNQAKKVTLATSTLFAYLTTAGAYTPTVNRQYRLWVYTRFA